MADLQRIREHCTGLTDAGLVRALVVDRAGNAAAFLDEAERELARRGLTVAAIVDRIRVRSGGDREAVVSIAAAVAMIDDAVPRRALAAFTHCLDETLWLQREGWGWVAHHYAGDAYGLSYLLADTAAARAVLERFLRLQAWRDAAGDGHHLDDWKTLVADADGGAVLALADRLAAGGVPHVVRAPLLAGEGAAAAVALLVPPDRLAEAVEVAGTGRVPVRRLRHQARQADAAGDRHAELAAYEQLCQADAGNPAVHYNHGVVLLELDRPEAAAAAFMRCAALGLERLGPGLSPSGSRGGPGGFLGIAAKLVGRAVGSPSRPAYPDFLDDARLRLEGLLERLGARTDLLHTVASIARVQGDLDAAAARYRQVLQLEPADEVARVQLDDLSAAD